MKGWSKADAPVQHKTAQTLEIWVIVFFKNNFLEACKVVTVRTLRRGGLFIFSFINIYIYVLLYSCVLLWVTGFSILESSPELPSWALEF